MTNQEAPKEIAAVLAIQARVRSLTVVQQQRVALIVEGVKAIVEAEPDAIVRALAVSMVNLTVSTNLRAEAGKVKP